MAGDYSNPYAAIAQLLAGAAARNNQQSGAGAHGSQKTANNQQLQNGGMQMEEAPAMDSAPSASTTQWDVVKNTGSMADPGTTQASFASPAIAGIVKGEQAMMQPTAPAVGGFVAQPGKVDSMQQPYQNSSMMPYLNYLKYRGGYR